MKQFTVKLDFVRETKNTVLYKTDEEKPITTAYVQKDALGKEFPTSITITAKETK